MSKKFMVVRTPEQKARLADDWVKLNMDTTNYSELQRSLDQEETRLKSIRNDVDPAQMRAVVFMDRVEVKAVFSIEPIDYQK